MEFLVSAAFDKAILTAWLRRDATNRSDSDVDGDLQNLAQLHGNLPVRRQRMIARRRNHFDQEPVHSKLYNLGKCNGRKLQEEINELIPGYSAPIRAHDRLVDSTVYGKEQTGVYANSNRVSVSSCLL